MLFLKYYNFRYRSNDPIPMLMFMLNINIQNNYINIFTDKLETYPYEQYALDTSYNNNFILDFNNINITTYNYQNFIINKRLNITININNSLQKNIVFNFE